MSKKKVSNKAGQHPLLQKFSENLDNLTPYPSNLKPQISFAIALSGGSDSLALLHLAASYLGKQDITALTVDHNLRAESLSEAQKVGNWVKALGIQHHILHWEHQANDDNNLQAAARQARYQLMADWCHAHKVPYLLLGHTADDQAETIAMRKERGAGSIGLAGMSAIRKESKITIVRPLLAHYRDALQTWLSAQKVEWINDPSNENDEFLRVRIRKELANTPQKKTELLVLGKEMAKERIRMEQTHAEFTRSHIRIKGEQLVMARNEFFLLPEPQAAYTLGCILQHIGGQNYAPRYAKRLQFIKHFRQEKPTGYSLGNCLVKQKDNSLFFVREKELPKLPSKPLVPSPFVPIFAE